MPENGWHTIWTFMSALRDRLLAVTGRWPIRRVGDRRCYTPVFVFENLRKSVFFCRRVCVVCMTVFVFVLFFIINSIAIEIGNFTTERRSKFSSVFFCYFTRMPSKFQNCSPEISSNQNTHHVQRFRPSNKAWPKLGIS